MAKTPTDIRERAFEFAVRIIKLCTLMRSEVSQGHKLPTIESWDFN